MKECPNTYYIVVIENTDTRKVVAAASLVLEQKFIHEIAMVRNLHFKKKFRISSSWQAFLLEHNMLQLVKVHIVNI